MIIYYYYKRRRYNWYKVTYYNKNKNNNEMLCFVERDLLQLPFGKFFFFNIITIIIHNDDDHSRSVESAVFRLRVGGHVLRVLLLVQRPNTTTMN